MAGTVGVILRAIEQRVGAAGRWVAGLAGVSWSAASVFVIPVIINEPLSKRPFDYLKISANLLKRVWGEGVIGLSSQWLAIVVLSVLLAVGTAIAFGSEFHMQIMVLSVVVFAMIAMLLSLAYQIFKCGLYVYATEGVAPGSFDEELFDRAWTVNKGPVAHEEQTAPRRVRWTKLWMLLPALMGGASLWFTFFSPDWTGNHPGPHLGSAVVNLADIGYRLNMDDLHAAGLFVGDKCRECDFSATGSMQSSHIGKPDAGLEVWMYKEGNQLWLHFYDNGVVNGPERMKRSLDALRARFPGHGGAIVLNPETDTHYVPRTTVAEWNPIPGAASYTIEVDCFHCCGEGKWCADIGSKWKIERNLHTTLYSFDWVGAQPGRWRVWAIEANGRPGIKSDWSYFDYSRVRN